MLLINPLGNKDYELENDKKSHCVSEAAAYMELQTIK